MKELGEWFSGHGVIMLNFNTIRSWMWVVLLGVLGVGCDEGNRSKHPANVQPLFMLSVDGVGPINAETPFNLRAINEAFPGMSVEQRLNYTAGEPYAVIEVSKDAKLLLVVNPDVKQQKIFSVVARDNSVGNQLKHPIGSGFTEVYAAGKTEECAAGAEELAGKVLCYAPQTSNILYQFGGVWNGKTGTVPPLDVLAKWKLEAIIWKPPVSPSPPAPLSR
jgi:hypothetical protein